MCCDLRHATKGSKKQESKRDKRQETRGKKAEERKEAKARQRRKAETGRREARQARQGDRKEGPGPSDIDRFADLMISVFVFQHYLSRPANQNTHPASHCHTSTPFVTTVI